MTIPEHCSIKNLSGVRFVVKYRIKGNKQEAEEKAEALRYEQTVEFPQDLTPDGDISDYIVGQLESFKERTDGAYDVELSYAEETAGTELTQLLNVVFGNSSITPGIRVEQIQKDAHLLRRFRGPRYGVQGIRDLLGVKGRPLLMTALKPMGLANSALAEIAYKCALGGLDIIKDDHGLANQPINTFEERVRLCADAVNQANKETGFKSVYAPNITAPAPEIQSRAQYAKKVDAKALLFIPMLAGFDTMRFLADNDELALPIISHPAFSGSFVTSYDNGFSHYALYGQIQRLAGADCSIYPNFGGRFSFSKKECVNIANGCTDTFGALFPIFPTPGGGMNMDSIPEMKSVYGQNVIYLIGGGLHRHSENLVENVRFFRDLVMQ